MIKWRWQKEIAADRKQIDCRHAIDNLRNSNSRLLACLCFCKHFENFLGLINS